MHSSFGSPRLPPDHPCVAILPITLTCPKPSKLPQNPHTWGEHIKKRRLELGLYQAEVAEILVVTESTVTNWEKNKTDPTLQLLPKIIKFVGYDPMPGDTENLGEKMLRYRKCRGVSQKELAKQMGIDPTTLSRLERNRGRHFSSVLEKVNSYLFMELCSRGQFESTKANGKEKHTPRDAD